MYLKKGTHKLTFLHPLTGVKVLFNGEIWIERDLPQGTKFINFNTLEDGEITLVNGGTITSEPLELKPCNIRLYEPERQRARDYKIVFNPYLTLQDTPARIFTLKSPAVIEIGRRYYTYPPQVRIFILLHERGHMLYQSEHKTDCWALKQYLGMGYNASQAFNALHKVLHTSEKSQYRIKKLFNELKENGYVN